MNRSIVARARASSSRDSPTTLPASASARVPTSLRSDAMVEARSAVIAASARAVTAAAASVASVRASSTMASLSDWAWARIWAASVRASASCAWYCS